MALINCPECGKEISTMADSCPNCGYPLKKDIPDGYKPFSVPQSELDRAGAAKPIINKTDYKSTTRFVIGIIMLVLSTFILFQSCAVGVANSFENPMANDGSLGFAFALFMVIFGIIGITTRSTSHVATPLIQGIIMSVIGIIIGLGYDGIFADLKIWGWLMCIFGVIYMVSAARLSRKTK